MALIEVNTSTFLTHRFDKVVVSTEKCPCGNDGTVLVMRYRDRNIVKKEFEFLYYCKTCYDTIINNGGI